MKRVVSMFALFALGVLALPAGAGGNKYGAADWPTHECKDDDGVTRGTVTASGPAKLWPPNHKLIDISFIGDATDDDDGVSLETGGSVTDLAGGDGGPNHDPDVTPAVRRVTDRAGDSNSDVDSDPDVDAGADLASTGDDVILEPDPDGEGTVTNKHSTRSERSGKNSDGRTYTYKWMITLTDNDTSSGGYGTITCESNSSTHFVQTVPHDMRTK